MSKKIFGPRKEDGRGKQMEGNNKELQHLYSSVNSVKVNIHQKQKPA
jgi:hypothetical protein